MTEPMEPTEPPGGGSEPWKNPWVLGGVVAVIILIVAAVAFFAMDDDEDDVVADTTTTEPEETTTSVEDGEEEEEEGPRTVTVQVDGELSTRDHVAMIGYFPKDATVRQGDTIEFPFAPGDPHSVTFGTVVDEAFSEMGSGDPQAAFDNVPQAVNEAEMAVDQAGALPCYSSDAPPTDGSPCEQQEQPEFTGSLAFYNSGLLNPDDTFTVDIADDAEPGTYNYFCTLHGPAMAGTVTVVEVDGEGQTAEVRGVDSTQRQIAALSAFIAFGFGAGVMRMTLPTLLRFIATG